MSQPPRDSPHTLSGPGYNPKRSDYREHRFREPLHRAIELHDSYWPGAPHRELDTLAESRKTDVNLTDG